MVLITIVTGACKPTYNWGGAQCANLGQIFPFCRGVLELMWLKQCHK